MAVDDGATAALPVAVEEVKAYLRIEGQEEDALLAGLIRAATGLCEGFTGQALIRRELRETIPAASEWRRLGRTPVQSISAVERLTVDGVATPLPVEAYAIDIDANGDGWVRTSSAAGATRLAVTYQAGMAGDWNGVPEPVRQGIVRLTAHLFTHRDAAEGVGPPAVVAALWRPWRRMRLK
jgi:uncharacterized phiE125 gp8 family phage protein